MRLRLFQGGIEGGVKPAAPGNGQAAALSGQRGELRTAGNGSLTRLLIQWKFSKAGNVSPKQSQTRARCVEIIIQNFTS